MPDICQSVCYYQFNNRLNYTALYLFHINTMVSAPLIVQDYNTVFKFDKFFIYSVLHARPYQYYNI